MSNHLYHWRKLNGFAAQDAANKIGVSRVTWWRWEQGQSKPDVSLLPRLCRLTGLSGAQLRPDIFTSAVTDGQANEQQA